MRSAGDLDLALSLLDWPNVAVIYCSALSFGAFDHTKCQDFRLHRCAIVTRAALDIGPVTTASGYFWAAPTCARKVIDVTGSYFFLQHAPDSVGD